MHSTDSLLLAPMPFFGSAKATPDFLRRYGLYYSRECDRTGAILMAERSPFEEVRVYVLQYLNGLRLLRPADLQELTSSQATQASDLDRLALASLPPRAGQLIYQLEVDDQDRLSGLEQFAAHAAQERGITSGTARWYMRLVEATFGGLGHDATLSDKGVLFATITLHATAGAIKRQLKKLQAVDALAFEAIRGGDGFHIRFNRELLAPLDFTLAPAFFQAFIY